MRRTLSFLAILTTFALIPVQAQAQRANRGTVNTPFGKFSMSEMRAAGGNPFAAELAREQKRMILNQQQMAKRQQLANRQQAQQKKAQASASTPKARPAKAAASSPPTSTTTPAKAAKAATPGDSKKAATASKVPGAPANPTQDSTGFELPGSKK